jgi:hypothetical protein
MHNQLIATQFQRLVTFRAIANLTTVDVALFLAECGVTLVWADQAHHYFRRVLVKLNEENPSDGNDYHGILLRTFRPNLRIPTYIPGQSLWYPSNPYGLDNTAPGPDHYRNHPTDFDIIPPEYLPSDIDVPMADAITGPTTGPSDQHTPATGAISDVIIVNTTAPVELPNQESTIQQGLTDITINNDVDAEGESDTEKPVPQPEAPVTA